MNGGLPSPLRAPLVLHPGAATLVNTWWKRYKGEIARSWDRTQQTGLVEAVPPLE